MVTTQSERGTVVDVTWKEEPSHEEPYLAAGDVRDVEGGFVADDSDVLNIEDEDVEDAAVHADTERVRGASVLDGPTRSSITNGDSDAFNMGPPEQIIFHEAVSPSRVSNRTSHRRRATIGPPNAPSTSRHTVHYTESSITTQASGGALLSSLHEVLGTQPTIATGFQIGLSPLSPGFSIAPRGRERRSSERFPSIESRFSDMEIDMTQNRRDQLRRRTASEGAVGRRWLILNDAQGVDTVQENLGLDGSGDEETHTPLLRLDKGKRKPRWRWMGRMFST